MSIPWKPKQKPQTSKDIADPKSNLIIYNKDMDIRKQLSNEDNKQRKA